jgi:hypothetical protein
MTDSFFLDRDGTQPQRDPYDPANQGIPRTRRDRSRPHQNAISGGWRSRRSRIGTLAAVGLVAVPAVVGWLAMRRNGG